MHYRKHAKQCSKKTLDREIAALERLDVWNGRKEFAKFHINWAMDFRTHLEQAKTAHDKPLSKSTQRAIMAMLRDFTIWLSQQDGVRRRIKLEHAEYFRLSLRDEAEASAAPESPAPSIKQAKRALAMMPDTTPRELRNKALVSLLCLCGPRVAAVASLRIKHVDLDENACGRSRASLPQSLVRRLISSFTRAFPRRKRSWPNGSLIWTRSRFLRRTIRSFRQLQFRRRAMMVSKLPVVLTVVGPPRTDPQDRQRRFQIGGA